MLDGGSGSGMPPSPIPVVLQAQVYGTVSLLFQLAHHADVHGQVILYVGAGKGQSGADGAGRIALPIQPGEQIVGHRTEAEVTGFQHEPEVGGKAFHLVVDKGFTHKDSRAGAPFFEIHQPAAQVFEAQATAEAGMLLIAGRNGELHLIQSIVVVEITAIVGDLADIDAAHRLVDQSHLLGAEPEIFKLLGFQGIGERAHLRNAHRLVAGQSEGGKDLSVAHMCQQRRVAIAAIGIVVQR